MTDLPDPLFDKIPELPDTGDRPLWSVMIPTYNPDDYLYDTLDCVTSQYPDEDSMQIMVVDDRSNRVDVQAMLRQYGNSRVKLYVNPGNVGHSFNFTQCIRQSRGKLIHILHCDDIVYPGFYKKFEEDFEKFPDAGAVYCRQAYIDENSIKKYYSEPDLTETGYLENAVVRLAERQRIQYCGMVVKRSVYEDVGGFINKNIGCEDWEMWVRIASKYPIVHDPAPLAGYRVHHGTSMTLKDMRTGQDMRFLRESAAIFNEYLPEQFQDEVKTYRQRYYGNFSFKNTKMLIEEHKDEEGAAAQISETIQLYPELVLENAGFLETLKNPVPALGVSVIVCMQNDTETIERTLRHIAIQRVPPYIPWEIILVDAGSSDDSAAKALETAERLKLDGRMKFLSLASEDLFTVYDKAVCESQYESVLFCNPGEYISRDYLKRASLNLLNDIELGAVSGFAEAVTPDYLPKWFDDYKFRSYQLGEQFDHSADITWSNGRLWYAGMIMRKAAWVDLIKKGYSQSVLWDPDDRRAVFSREFYRALRALGWRLWYSVELSLKKNLAQDKLRWRFVLDEAAYKGVQDLHLTKYKLPDGRKRLRSLTGLKESYDMRRTLAVNIRSLRRIPSEKKSLYPEYIVGDKDSLKLFRAAAIIREVLSRVKSGNKRLRLLRRYAMKRDLALLGKATGISRFRFPQYYRKNDARGVSAVVSFTGSSYAHLHDCLMNLSKQKVTAGLPWEVIVVSVSFDQSAKLKLLNEWERSGAGTSLRFFELPDLSQLTFEALAASKARHNCLILMDEFCLPDTDFVRVSYKLHVRHPNAGVIGGVSSPHSYVKLPRWFNSNKHLYGFSDQPQAPTELSAPSGELLTGAVVVRKTSLNQFTPSAEEISSQEETSLAEKIARRFHSHGMQVRFEPRLRMKKLVTLEDLRWEMLRTKYREEGIADFGKEGHERKSLRIKQLNQTVGELLRYPVKKIFSHGDEYENDTEVLKVEKLIGRLRAQLGNGNGAIPLKSRKQSLPERTGSVEGVSVVICCYNSRRLLPKTLRTLFRQKTPPWLNWEIIVVDNASTDGTSAEAERLFRESSFTMPFRVVSEPEPGLSHARKKGVETSRYDFVIFCDDDNQPHSDYVARVFEIMSGDTKIGILGGMSRGSFEVEPPFWFEDWKGSFAIGKQHNLQGDITDSKGYVWGAAMAVRKSAWVKLQEAGFRSRLSDRKGTALSSGGDTELCYAVRNLGYKIWYDESLKFVHYMPVSRVNWNYLSKLFRGFGEASFGLDAYNVRGNGRKRAIRRPRKEIWKVLKILRKPNYKMLLHPRSRKEGNQDIPMVEYCIGRIESIISGRGGENSGLHYLKRTASKKELKRIGIHLGKGPAYTKKKALNGVSVIICTFNGESRLPETLSYIAKQKTHPDLLWEVILVDNASTDNTKQASIDEWSKHDCRAHLKIVDEYTQGLSAARHRGFVNAKYNYLVLCDDDNWLDENFVQLTYDIMSKDSSIGILGGPNQAQFEEKPPEWYKWFQHGYAAGPQMDFKTNKVSEGDITWKRGFVWGAGMILRKKAVEELYSRGFTSMMSDRKGYQLSSGGDSELCFALVLSGWKVWYDSRLTCYHMMPSGRVTWNYLIRLFQGFGITSVGLDPYEKAIQLGRADIIEKEILSLNWKYEFRKVLSELRKAGLRQLLALKRAQDNNTKFPMIEFYLARLAELWRVRNEYDKNLDAVRNAVWRIDVKALRKRHRKFVETENDFRFGWPWMPANTQNAEADLPDNSVPKISVLSPSFNSENTIEKAILSVLHQGYPNFEHIICDGGSKDNTVNIIRKYPHIRWISEPDEGQCDAMNKAFGMATGDVIVYLNVDDYFQRGAFEKVAMAFIQNPDADIVLGNLFFDFEEHVYMRKPESEYQRILRPFLYIFPINPVSYFYRKSVQDMTGPFPLDNHYTMDYWFLLKAFQHSKVIKIDQFLGTFWMNGFNKTSAADNRKNVHNTALRHLWQNDRKSLPGYLYSYYKHYYYDTKPYNLSKIYGNLRKNLSRIYNILTLRKNLYYSNKLYKKARSSYYIGKRFKALAIMQLSFLIYPKGLSQRSKQSLTVYALLGNEGAEKAKKAYMFLTTPPGVPLGNKVDYFGKQFYNEGHKAKGRSLILLSYLLSPKFFFDEDYVFKPEGRGNPNKFIQAINPVQRIRRTYGYFKHRRYASTSAFFYERAGVHYNMKNRFIATYWSLLAILAYPKASNGKARRKLLYYSAFGRNTMERLNILHHLYKDNPENSFAHKLNYYGNQQRREGNSGFGNSVLLLAYLLSPKYILQREKISKPGKIYSSQVQDVKLRKKPSAKDLMTKPSEVAGKLKVSKTDISRGFSNSMEMNKYRFRKSVDYFRYRKYKAKSKDLYITAQEEYRKGNMRKIPGLMIPSFLLYPPSLTNRNKWGLLVNSMRKGKNTGK